MSYRQEETRVQCYFRQVMLKDFKGLIMSHIICHTVAMNLDQLLLPLLPLNIMMTTTPAHPSIDTVT